MKILHCRVRETMDVDEESLTNIINSMHKEGYALDGLHFAMRESSKRPAMAFLIFYKYEEGEPPRPARVRKNRATD
jgi:hypothetical protein